MNFIDNLLVNMKSMSANDIIQAMSQIYDEPIERAELEKYPQFIQDTIYVIDFDTELSKDKGIAMVSDNEPYRLMEIHMLKERMKQLQFVLEGFRCKLQNEEEVVDWLEDLSQSPPWGNNIADTITNLSNYYVTSDGNDFIGVFEQALAKAQQMKKEIMIK